MEKYIHTRRSYNRKAAHRISTGITREHPVLVIDDDRNSFYLIPGYEVGQSRNEQNVRVSEVKLIPENEIPRIEEIVKNYFEEDNKAPSKRSIFWNEDLLNETKSINLRSVKRRHEVEIYKKNGVEENLANVIGNVFRPLSWAPANKNITERTLEAKTASDFHDLSFSEILRGNKRQAKSYMIRANRIKQDSERETIIANFNTVYETLQNTTPHLDLFRQGLGQFKNYLSIAKK